MRQLICRECGNPCEAEPRKDARENCDEDSEDSLQGLWSDCCHAEMMGIGYQIDVLEYILARPSEEERWVE